MPRSSSARATAPTPFEAATFRIRRRVPLKDLDVAPENLRAGEPADDGVPQLADTLLAAGQLQPLTVRPGRRRERPWMTLDGRRRLLALRLLAEQGRIEDRFQVDVFVETEPARQAAAAVLTNTAAPVHVADVIAAIGRMLTSKLDVPTIARALGHAEIDVKRLAALSALPEAAVSALRLGRLNLRQARLLARLPDAAEQAELAQAALDGQGFADWRVVEKLDRAQVDATDPRCALVTPERYAEAGGRMETDLFGERAPALLDPSLLTDLWMGRAAEIAAPFEAQGLTVNVSPHGDIDLPDDLEAPGYVYGGRLPADEMALYREARSEFETAAEAVQETLAAASGSEAETDAIAAMIRAALVRDQLALGGRVATVLALGASRRYGVSIGIYAPVEPEIADEGDAEGEGRSSIPEEDGPAPFTPPTAAAPLPEVDGVGHGLHALRTEVATRGLIRALADDPRAAMTALIARLFAVVAGPGVRSPSASALTVTAEVFGPRGGRVIPAVDGVVRERLDDRRAAWEASGLTLIRWVHDLDDGERLALLADLTALTLDLREARTDRIRTEARAEAGELAALCGADITRHWTPDADFLAAHSKALLSAMLEAMGKAAPRRPAPGKADLVALVEATAAARNWAPSVLSWQGGGDEEGAAETPDDPDAGDPGSGRSEPAPAAGDGDDGVGAFEVTVEGEAALAHAAE
ncbi:ParB N-terminal domain-containing protein [Brevundimonas lutea]|uniref:ParB N-terminal domain-containing protein n=1 Tax=Brevundimonas lutea TaxID=2293980 RepID=UPI0013CE5B38|nr:ParB N-terminal domain-containing protein [Brevundimonas lutea]